MDLREWRKQLHMASSSGDLFAVAGLLEDQPPTECLQAVGEALANLPPGAEVDALIARTVEELRQRDWAGDQQLANELSQPDLGLRGIPVDLEALGEVLDGPAGTSGLLDLESGMAWSEELLDNARDAGIEDLPEEPDGTRWLHLLAEGHGGRDMRAFIGTLTDVELAERLDRSLRGKGAFRRFRNELERTPTEASRWHAFKDDRSIGRARAWLAEAGYRAQQTPA